MGQTNESFSGLKKKSELKQIKRCFLSFPNTSKECKASTQGDFYEDWRQTGVRSRFKRPL